MFRFKYAQGPGDTWEKLADRLVEDVCGSRWGTQPVLLNKEDQRQLAQYIKEFNKRILYLSQRDNRNMYEKRAAKAIGTISPGAFVRPYYG